MRSAVIHAAIALLVLLGGGEPHAQELSTAVFPSEDEIVQALRSGEITWEQYLALQEILSHGLDSTNLHLLDEIPNLSFFISDTASFVTSLESDQRAPFNAAQSPTGHLAVSGSIQHRYYQSLDTDSPSKYESTVQADIADCLSSYLKLRREYSGYERITGRAITYKSSAGTLREITVGNFSRRLGLGTVVGYRGKLLSASENLDTESLAYPDHGGFNGAAVRLSTGWCEMDALGSVARDDAHRLSTLGGALRLSRASLKPTAIFGVTTVTNRLIDQMVTDVKYGIDLNHTYGRGYGNLELCWQAGERPSFGVVVAEGRHRFQSAQLFYAGWVYSDNYIDLSGGSKAGNLRHTDRLDNVDFEFSTKRAGQKGGLLKTVVSASEATKLASSLVFSSFNRDTTNLEWLVELNRNLGRRLTMSLDFLSRSQERLSSDGGNHHSEKRQTRLEARFRTPQFYIRSHAAYSTATDRQDCITFFISCRLSVKSYGELEIWSNLARYDHIENRIENWYGYIRNGFRLADGLQAAVKLSHSFDFNRLDRDQTQVLFELGASL